MAHPDLIPLALLRPELDLTEQEAATLQAVRHRAIHEAILDGRIPGAVRVNARWYIRREALPEVKAAVLALARGPASSAIAA